jgi:putative membrane protein
MRLVFWSSALTVLALVSSIAQPTKKPHPPTLSIGNPRSPTAETKGTVPSVPPARHANLSDQVFVTRATVGNAAVLDLELLAEQKNRSGAARDFTRIAIRDHSQAANTLRQLVEEHGITVPRQLDIDHESVRNVLNSLDGPEFDIEYLRVQIQQHQRLAQLMEYEIGSGADAQVQGFASDTLPWILMHLGMARNLLDQVSIQNPQIAAAPPKVSGMPTVQTQPVAGPSHMVQ